MKGRKEKITIRRGTKKFNERRKSMCKMKKRNQKVNGLWEEIKNSTLEGRKK
jgi:hypothetical protein